MNKINPRSNRIKENASKFSTAVGPTGLASGASAPTESNFAQNEINEWFNENTCDKVKLLNKTENVITISMDFNKKTHVVEITHPRAYPNVKTGFKVAERPQHGVPPLKFIEQAHNKYHNRVLNLKQILTNLTKPIKELMNEPMGISTVLTASTIASLPMLTESSVESSAVISSTIDLSKSETVTAKLDTTQNSPVSFSVEPDSNADTFAKDLEIISRILESSNIPVVTELSETPTTIPMSDERESQPMPIFDTQNIIGGIPKISSEILQTGIPIFLTENPISSRETPTETLTIPTETLTTPTETLTTPTEVPTQTTPPNNSETINLAESQSQVIEMPASPLNTITKVVTTKVYDDFVSSHFKIFRHKHPKMDEDSIMDLIQEAWEAQKDDGENHLDEDKDESESGNNKYSMPKLQKLLIIDSDSEDNSETDPADIFKDRRVVKHKKDTSDKEDTDEKEVNEEVAEEVVEAEDEEEADDDDDQPKPKIKMFAPSKTKVVEDEENEKNEEDEEDDDEPVSKKKMTKDDDDEIDEEIIDDNRKARILTPHQKFMGNAIQDLQRTTPGLAMREYMTRANELWQNRSAVSKKKIEEDEEDSEDDSITEKPKYSKNASIRQLTPHQAFMASTMKRLYKEMPGLENGEYMSMANNLWRAREKDPNTKTDKTKVDSVDKSPQLGSDIITFDDALVDDSIGMYLDLGKYTAIQSYPFDLNVLKTKAAELQLEMEFADTSKVKKSFSSVGSVIVAINELKEVYRYGTTHKFEVIPVDNNIYNLNLAFGREFFDSTSKIFQDLKVGQKNLELNIKLDGKLYPFYPPKVRVISPRLKNYLNNEIATMECLLLSNWNPICSLITVINCFRDIVNQEGELDSGCTVTSYDELENELIDLSALTEIPARINITKTLEELKHIKHHQENFEKNAPNESNEPNETEQTSVKYKSKSHKSGWIKGTGYGYSGLSGWDFDATLKAKEERKVKLNKCLYNITKRLTKIILSNVQLDVVTIVANSCLIPYLKSIFYENSVLDLLKDQKHFELTLNLMRVMPRQFTSLFLIKDNSDEKSLAEIFTSFKTDCELYLATLKKNTTISNETKIEIDSVSNFVSFQKKVMKNIDLIEKEAQLICGSLTNPGLETQTVGLSSVKERYCTQLKNEVFKSNNEMDIHQFERLMNDAGEKVGTEFSNPKAVSHIAKELVSLQKSLPLAYESSIFHRFNENNLKYHEFMITGSQDTPYDSGCFLFRLYCTSTYPQTNPKVHTCTTGHGQVKFNPNLYSDGRICLSLVGTWNADASESWIPGVSTMMQIMISIQSLILTATPYYNESGREGIVGTKSGEKASNEYNKEIRLNTMKWAMIDSIKNPPSGFETAVRTHFTLKADYVKKMCLEWVFDAAPRDKLNYQQTYDKLCTELDKLTGTKPSTVSKTKESVSKSTKSETKAVDKKATAIISKTKSYFKPSKKN